MQNFYDDINVLGTFTATMIDGELSERALQPLTDAIVDKDRELAELSARFDETASALTELASVKATNEMLAAKYNSAIEVINNLSERLAALESNYDPTVIK